MSETTTGIELRSNPLVVAVPFLLWLLAFVVPMHLGMKMVFSVVESEERQWFFSAGQTLIAEAQKFNNLLDPEQFMHWAADYRRIGHLYRQHFRLELNDFKPGETYDEGQIVNALRQHYILRHLPWGSNNLKEDIKPFLGRMKKFIGIDPAAIYCLGPDEKSCFVVPSGPFSLLLPEEEFKKTLEIAYQFYLHRFQLGLSPDRYFYIFNTTPELKRWLGYMLPPYADISGVRERFSARARDTVYQIVFRLHDAAGKNVCLNLLYARLDLNWKFMMRSVLQRVNTGRIKYEFGYSNLENLPRLVQGDDKIEFFVELPSEFRQIFLADPHSRKDITPVLRLSLKMNHKEKAAVKKKNISFVVLLLMLTSAILPIGLALGRFSAWRSMKALISSAFFIGTLIPVIGLAWLSLSYQASQRQFNAQKVLARMDELIAEAEKRLLLLKMRNEVYYSLLHLSIDSLNAKHRKNLAKILKSSITSERSYEKSARPFVGIYLLNSDGFELFDIRQNYLANLIQIKPFFTGYFSDILLEMGVFRNLANSRQLEISQRAQLALGMIESLSDPKMFRMVAELEGTRIASTISPKHEFFTGFFLDRHQEIPGGLMVVYADNGDWLWQFGGILLNGGLPLKHRVDDYKIVVGFFRLDKLNLNSIDLMRFRPGLLDSQEVQRLSQLGNSMFLLSGNSAIKSQSDKGESLVLSRAIAENNVFALAYAERTGNDKQATSAALLLLILLTAIALSGCLAAATARILVMALPAFAKAIEQAQKQNYCWQIELQSGDEFENLAASFNLMSQKMREREMMSQLVSENVLEAISSENSAMLKPGGEKRHAAVLFSDIRGFTTLSENYSAEEIVEMLNSYFTAMAGEITGRGGIIDKLIGDAIQAVFFPRDDMEAPETRAVAAAVAMRQRLEEFNCRRLAEGKFAVKNGIGIASGNVIAGRVGSETGKLDAAVFGKTLHQAESLEARCKQAIKSNILIDCNTFLIVARQKYRFFPVKSGETEDAFEVLPIQES